MGHHAIKYLKTTTSSLMLCMFFSGLLLCSPYATADSVEELPVGRFTVSKSPEGLPEGWKAFAFPKKKRLTEYSVLNEGSTGFVKAVSAQSASAIYTEVEADLKRFPYFTWKWKVDGTIKNEAEGKKAGDDFSARVYVTFAPDPKASSYFDRLKRSLASSLFGTKLPGNAINYVWASHLEKDAVLKSPYTDSVAVMAIESGDAEAGQWVTEERNVYEDYKKCFNAEPPKVLAVVIMTDSDNTGTSATGYYADIAFRNHSGALNAMHASRLAK